MFGDGQGCVGGWVRLEVPRVLAEDRIPLRGFRLEDE